MKPENRRLVVYVICFSIVPAIIVGHIEDEHGFIWRKHCGMAGWLGFLVAVFLFGAVFAIWRIFNRPKAPAKIIEKIIVQQKQPTQQTPVQQTKKTNE